ncbi:hypothetical protein AAEX28_02070 [Lentisphaerota bacterium WC36G]|nr:hypothetical protein LJT99_04955 [Lentisphaerae bacterium WC36]
MSENLKQANSEDICTVLESQQLLGTFASINNLTIDAARFVLQKSLSPNIDLTEIEENYYMSSNFRQQEFITKQDAHRSGFWKGIFGGTVLTILGVFVISHLDE